jgi:hypothetical protein
MKSVLKNKVGGEKIFSLWWFFVLALTGGVIVAGVFIFYSSPIDARGVESNTLNDKISNCLIRQGYLVDDALDKDFSIFEKCYLNEDVFLGKTSFYFNIIFSNEAGKIREDIAQGDFSFEKDCEIASEVKADEFPRCYKNIQPFYYYENGKMKKGNLQILTASNQKGRRIPKTSA